MNEAIHDAQIQGLPAKATESILFVSCGTAVLQK